MKRKQRILNILNENFIDFDINIYDNSKEHAGHHNFNGLEETHLSVYLKVIKSKKIDRLQIHRKVNELVKDEYSNGLHSLQIKIK